MKLIHVVPHISEEASGPSYSVPRLCQSLAALGHDVELSCLAAAHPIPGVRTTVHPQWPFLSRFAVSHRHALALHASASHVDVVHNHSLWSMVNVASGFAVPGRRAKLVVSPRGTLSPWALSHSRAIKRTLWPLQKRALERADLLHATSRMEFTEIREQGLKAPVAIVPNGIDLPPLVSRPERSGPRTLLFLSRIHPKKGLDHLLHAWRALESAHPDWQLVIAGKGEPAHEQAASALASELHLKRVSFPGALYGEQKSLAYRQASLFVLPTHSENFGMVVAEALAHACPVVVSRGAPWEGIEHERCGWWVSNDVETLAASLSHAMATDETALANMGERGRAWMERDFSWASVSSRLASAYAAIVSGGPFPDCVESG